MAARWKAASGGRIRSSATGPRVRCDDCPCEVVNTCTECDVSGRSVQIDVDGVGTFVTSAFTSGATTCNAEYEGSTPVCTTEDPDFEPERSGGQWFCAIKEPSSGSLMALIGPFDDCHDLFSDSGVLHENVSIPLCGWTWDITLTLLP